jgi:hypothetical protein
MWTHGKGGTQMAKTYYDEDRRRVNLGTLTNHSFISQRLEKTYYVQADVPVVRTLDFCAMPVGSSAAVMDKAKITAIALDFDDTSPTYSLDAKNGGCANFFLRQHDDTGVADYKDLNIRYKILPANAIGVSDVGINIYPGGDTNKSIASLEGQKVNDKYKLGDGHVVWNDVREKDGNFREAGFYVVQLEVTIEGRTIKTPIGDAEIAPGYQCKDRCLVIHDLVYKHRPVVYMGAGETVAKKGPVYPFDNTIRDNYRIQSRASTVLWRFSLVDYSVPKDDSQYRPFPSDSFEERIDYYSKYPVLDASIHQDSHNAEHHYIDIDNSKRNCNEADPALFHRGHVVRVGSSTYCFIQYWMYETYSNCK